MKAPLILFLFLHTKLYDCFLNCNHDFQKRGFRVKLSYNFRLIETANAELPIA